jgi:hypothetical protein
MCLLKKLFLLQFIELTKNLAPHPQTTSCKEGTSLVSLLSLQKINNILSRKSLLSSCPLWLHYLGEMMALKVKLTFHPTLLSLWIMAMPSIKALGAT